jgi:hypothetical protein
MAGTVELTRLAQESRLIQERDAADLREQLLQLVRKTDSLKQLLIDTGDVEQLMQTLQEVRLLMDHVSSPELIRLTFPGNPIRTSIRC